MAENLPVSQQDLLCPDCDNANPAPASEVTVVIDHNGEAVASHKCGQFLKYDPKERCPYPLPQQ